MGVRRARWMLLLAAGCANLSSFTGGDGGTGGDASPSDAALDDASKPADSAPGDTSATDSTLADATMLDATDAHDAHDVPDGSITVMGTVGGLLPGSSVVLQDNGSDTLTVSANASFAFATAIPPGGSYDVTVRTQPSSPPELCTITGGTGTSSDPTPNVTVSCDTVTSVSTGVFMSCALLSHGTVDCWGDNTVGELGDNTSLNSSVPVQVLGLFEVTQLSVGYAHVCAVVSSGSVYCWGDNANEQLGTPTPSFAMRPQQVPLTPLGATASAVVAGGYHTCAILTSGSVECWGDNTFGQLGGGMPMAAAPPLVASGVTGATQLAAGEYHTCAIAGDAGVECWGYNGSGQLGNGSTASTPSPVSPMIAGTSAGATAICAGADHSCLVTSTGSVFCWGENLSGQVGDGTLTQRNVPVDVPLNFAAAQVSCGNDQTCARGVAGDVVCWGANAEGQLGNGSTMPTMAPGALAGVSGAITVSTGSNDTCALLDGGSVQCWGSNAYGELGNGATTQLTAPTPVGNVTTGKAISTGYSNQTCALLDGGTVQCWGYNGSGQLGNGTTLNTSVPAPVVSLLGATAVSTSGNHTCAVLGDGGVECWGDNLYGELGNGSVVASAVPVPVSGLTGAALVSSGSSFSCALLSDGGVDCWGQNSTAQLGDGIMNAMSSTPVPVTGLPGAKALASGGTHTCAILSADGGVDCWGNGYNGQLGNDTAVPSPTPVAVDNLGGAAIAIAGGFEHTCALLAGGTVDCWGINTSGQLGNGTMTTALTATAVPGLTGAIAIATGTVHTCAVLTGGGVDCWGGNGYGQLGNGGTAESLLPAPVLGLGGAAVAIAAGASHTCAVLASGAIECWGWVGYGATGNGATTQVPTPAPVE